MQNWGLTPFFVRAWTGSARRGLDMAVRDFDASGIFAAKAMTITHPGIVPGLHPAPMTMDSM